MQQFPLKAHLRERLDGKSVEINRERKIQLEKAKENRCYQGRQNQQKENENEELESIGKYIITIIKITQGTVG